MSKYKVVETFFVDPANNLVIDNSKEFRTKQKACLYLEKKKSELVSQGFKINVNLKDPFDFYAYMEANTRVIKDSSFRIEPVE